MILNCLGIDILAYETLDLLKNVMKQKGLVDATSEKELTNKTACINRLVDICVKYDGFYFLKGYPVELYPLCKTEDGTCFADMEYLFFNGMCVAQLCKEETNPLRLNEMLVLQAENSNKNVSADESVITDGKIDPKKLKPIAFDPCNNAYLAMGDKVGNAFKDGAALK